MRTFLALPSRASLVFLGQTVRYCDASGALSYVTSAGAAMSVAPPGDDGSTWASSKCSVGHWGVRAASDTGESHNVSEYRAVECVGLPCLRLGWLTLSRWHKPHEVSHPCGTVVVFLRSHQPWSAGRYGEVSLSECACNTVQDGSAATLLK